MKVLYFAWFREKIGCGEETLSLPPEVETVAQLLVWLKGQSPGHAEALKDPSLVRVAVNQAYAGADDAVGDGDEVALFPPVTGG